MQIRLIIFVILLFGWFSLPAFDTYPEAFAAGQKAERQKQFSLAIEHYREAERLAKNYNEKYNSIFRQAETLRQNKQWDKARETLRRILSIKNVTSRQRSTASIYIAHYFNWEGKLDEALAIFENVTANPKITADFHTDAFINIGHILNRQKKYEDALSAFSQAESMSKSFPHLQVNALLGQASTFSSLKKYEDAHRVIEKAKNIPDIPPHSLADCIYRLGLLYYAEKKYQEALDEFNQIFIMDKPQRYYLDTIDWHIGNVYYHGLKNLEKAKYHYTRAQNSPVSWCAKNAGTMLTAIEKTEKK